MQTCITLVVLILMLSLPFTQFLYSHSAAKIKSLHISLPICLLLSLSFSFFLSLLEVIINCGFTASINKYTEVGSCVSDVLDYPQLEFKQ